MVDKKTYLMRIKEGEADYRYMPDPDLPPMRIDENWLMRVRQATPELPDAKFERYLKLGLRDYDANIIAFDAALSQFFDAALASYQGKAQNLANWLNSDVVGLLNQQNLAFKTLALRPEDLSKLLSMVDEGQISGRIAKDLLPEVLLGAEPEACVKARGLSQISDDSALESLVDEVLAANPDLVERVKANPKAINALLGQIMKASQGKAKPDAVRSILDKRFS